MKNGALYIRVSTTDQEELSPDAQKRLLLEHAKKHDIIVSNDFVFMESVSGRQAKKRPEFQRMIALAKQPEHPIDVILVWKYSRFARNQEESIVYKSMLRKDHVEVVSISEPLIDGPFGSLIERIIEWMDEYYSIRLSGEVLRGMKEKALKNGYQFAPPLGYQCVGGGKPFVIDPGESEIIRFIYAQFDLGRDETHIARLCNGRGYRTRRGNPFERRTIDRILASPFYCGQVNWNGISFDGTHDRYCTPEEYERRKSIICARRRPPRSRNVSTCRHWLSGLLHCSTCGASLAYGGSTSSRTFSCWKYTKGYHDTPCCVSVKKAERAVFDYFDRILAGEDFTFTFKGNPPSSPELDELEDVSRELDRIDMKLQRVRDAYENGIDSLEEYRANRERLNRNRAELEERLRSLRSEPEEITVDKNTVLENVRHVNEYLQNPDVGFEEKGTLIRSVVDNIVFDGKKREFYIDIISS